MSEENRSPSKEVRRMLDERGIKHTIDDSDDYEIIEWSSAYNLWWQFVYDPYEEEPYGELRLLEAGGSTHLTPEQAIAVTVGNSTDLSKRLREVQSCMADLKSGHGLNFYGDENWLVMPVELFEPYKHEVIENPNGYVSQQTSRARCLLYGIGRNGRPTFWEQASDYASSWACRKRSASELLFAMMRAMIANSDHSSIDHPISRIEVSER